MENISFFYCFGFLKHEKLEKLVCWLFGVLWTFFLKVRKI